MRRLLAISIAATTLCLSACGTIQFVPAEYPLRDGLVTAMPVHGDVKVTNAQPSSDQVLVYMYGGSNLGSNLRAITEVMVSQASREIAKASHPESGSAKTIDLKVTSLLSEYAIPYHFKSKLQFEARLGDGEVITKTVPHSSGILQQDLDGCIAEAVIALLNDEKVRAYLAQ